CNEQNVAIKFVHKNSDAQTFKSRFQQETSAMRCLNHPNIVQFHGKGKLDTEQEFIAMELLENKNVLEHVQEFNLGIQSKLQLFTGVCQAVAHCHNRGIIHRDIKPTNILIQKQNGQYAPKLIDFGVAKSFNETKHPPMLAVNENYLVGTVQYMSPEQVSRSRKAIDHRTDIYSLGILLFEFVTGSPPISFEQLMNEPLESIFEQIAEAQTPTLNLKDWAHRIDPLLIGALNIIFSRTLTLDPKDRYATAEDLKNDIVAILEQIGETSDARQPSETPALMIQSRPSFFRKNAPKFLGNQAIALAILLFFLLTFRATPGMPTGNKSYFRSGSQNLILDHSVKTGPYQTAMKPFRVESNLEPVGSPSVKRLPVRSNLPISNRVKPPVHSAQLAVEIQPDGFPIGSFRRPHKNSGRELSQSTQAPTDPKKPWTQSNLTQSDYGILSRLIPRMPLSLFRKCQVQAALQPIWH
ncbi:MAG: serine/threonine-protein kinase, partial [Planctomycetota bacterium]|nr:serine/threonine-protein kinase [Planctomycetota bacterium]